MFSVLNINKDIGMTSHDVVSKLRRIYNLKKIGHCGTLDPMATGVLPVCLGQATRLIEFFPDDKCYVAEMTLGITTTTLDAEGDIISTNSASGVTREQVEASLADFKGNIIQQVPLYSATHVKGKKLYELARQFEAKADGDPEILKQLMLDNNIVLPEKEVTIHRIELLDFKVPADNPEHPVAIIEVSCSTGTYIRSLVRDIGQTLKVGAHLSALSRSRHGQFSLDNTVTIKELELSNKPEVFLQNPAEFLDLPVIRLGFPEQAKKILNGMTITLSEKESEKSGIKTNQQYFLTYRDNPLCVATGTSGKNGQLKPLKVFNTVTTV